MKKLLITFLVVFAIVVIIHMFIKRNPAKVAAVKNAWKNGGATSLIAALPGGAIAQAVAGVVNDTTNSSQVNFPIQLGSTGKAVKFIQAALSLPINGTFDAATQSALQKQANIMAVDKNTFIGMFENNSGGGTFPLSIGSQGLYVQDVQILLDQPPNGVFSTDTAAALVGMGVSMPFTVDDYQRLAGAVLQLPDMAQVAVDQPVIIDYPAPVDNLPVYQQPFLRPITIDYPAPIDDIDGGSITPLSDPTLLTRTPGYIYDDKGNVVGQTTTMYPRL